MSARSAQRTRWRRWRMGWDIAGRKDRYGRLSGSQVVGSAETSAPWPSRFFVSFFTTDEANLFIRIKYKSLYKTLKDSTL